MSNVATGVRWIDLEMIDLEASPLARASICNDTVQAYMRVMREQVEYSFPPITAFYCPIREKYLVGDGHHRVLAARAAPLLRILAEVREGGMEAAQRSAATANLTHGLPPSLGDLVCQAKLLLRHPDFRHKRPYTLAEDTGLPALVLEFARWDDTPPPNPPPTAGRRECGLVNS